MTTRLGKELCKSEALSNGWDPGLLSVVWGALGAWLGADSKGLGKD